MRILGTALRKYASANNGFLPSAENWSDVLIKFDPNLSKDNFKPPRIDDASIAFNKNLSGEKLEDLPEDIVPLFVVYGGLNVSNEALRSLQSVFPDSPDEFPAIESAKQYYRQRYKATVTNSVVGLS